MVEFTGERVVPGEVDRDLWNEHLARYAFAARLARRKRVLDAGCGTGYGAAELSRVASAVIGIDVAAEAVRHCHQHYPIPNVAFVQASCSQIPLASGSIDLVVAFEVIEHLQDWRGFLQEARRVLAGGGQCILSTPNKDYYTDSRGEHGANPFHVHEFTFQEFGDELRAVFPHVSLFLQNRAEGFVFQPDKIFTPAEARVESSAGGPEASSFFVAVCAASPQTGAPTFLFVPRAANILREREQHIAKLNHELGLKEQTIAELSAERETLTDLFRKQEQELREHNVWAERLNGELETARQLVAKLQAELSEQATGYEAKIAQLQNELSDHSRGYEQKIAELEEESRRKTAWGHEIEQRLTGDLRKAVDALHSVEKTLEERTVWAQSLDRRVQDLEAELNLLRSSRWFKLGSALRVGPRQRND